jgi:hypothetical protein
MMQPISPNDISFIDVTVPASVSIPILPVVVNEESAIVEDNDAESAEDLASEEEIQKETVFI